MGWPVAVSSERRTGNETFAVARSVVRVSSRVGGGTHRVRSPRFHVRDDPGRCPGLPNHAPSGLKRPGLGKRALPRASRQFRRQWLLLALTVVPIAVAGCHRTRQPSSPAEATREPRLSGGATSLDELLDEFQQALEAKDRRALDALRVTEAEYYAVVIPGSVPEGAPLQRMPERKAKFLWDLHNTKSYYAGSRLLGAFGGRKLTRREVHSGGGVKTYALFTAYGYLEIDLEDEKGAPVQISTGSVIERDGQFKFVSFHGD
jgi:hypothetical protein